MKKLTTEEFIERAKKIHGDKYDYSLVDYINTDIKVKIICPEHGIFEQKPNYHIQGSGCSKCTGKNVFTIQDFIKKSKEIHGDKYNYSEVIYINTDTKVKIFCPEHGIFEQTPHNHLKGQGCTNCKKITSEKFINNAKKIHNNIYDYSLINYKNNSTKIKIICPEHGEFEQLPHNHLSGSGCPICSNINMKLKLKKSTNEFIEKSKEIHKDKYDYSKVDYINAFTKVKIICIRHGIFNQEPNNHLRGNGCPKCNNENKKLDIDEFINKSKKIHNNKYDYSLVVYINSVTKVKIICPEHGIFEQAPHSHSIGQGCLRCSKVTTTKDFISKAIKTHGNKYDYSKVEYVNNKTKVKIICPEHGIFEQNTTSHLNYTGCPKCAGQGDDRYLYIFYDKIFDIYKIGVSAYPEKRLKHICIGSENNLILFNKYEKCSYLEKITHKKYAQNCVEHTIYMDGKYEWFKLSKEDLYEIDIFIKSHIEDNFDHNQ